MRRWRIITLALVSLMPVFVSCEHRVLTVPKDNHYIRVYLDEQIKNVTCGFYGTGYERPEYAAPTNLRVSLADQQTGEVLYERIIRGYGEDEKGRYIDGYISAPTGRYNLVIHEVGTSQTKISNLYDYYSIYAYTDPILQDHYYFIPAASRAENDYRIVQQPDHMFHAVCEPVEVHNATYADTLRNRSGDHFTARSIALSYFTRVRIKGIEWVTSAAAIISGMSGSYKLGGEYNLVEDDPVNIFFTTKYIGKKRNSPSDPYSAEIYATFNTFGRINDLSPTLRIEFLKTDGSSQVEEFELTELFKTAEVKDNQWILLDREVEVTKPDGTGGMRPGVIGWKDIESDITM